MKRKIYGLISSLIVFAVVFYVFNNKPDTDNYDASASDFTSESEKVTYNQAEYNAVNDAYEELNKLLENNKEVFDKTAALIFQQESYVRISYDKENKTIELVNIDNELFSADEVFSADEQSLILSCFDKMSQMNPFDANLVISKRLSSAELVYADFMFRASFEDSGYVDYGVLYAEQGISEQYQKISDNWYKYEYWLV